MYPKAQCDEQFSEYAAALQGACKGVCSDTAGHPAEKVVVGEEVKIRFAFKNETEITVK